MVLNQETKRWALILAMMTASGCVSGGPGGLGGVVDALEEMQGNASPVVEAYIQYPGPDARWAGPVLWSVHVSARDASSLRFEVAPALPRAQVLPELSNRVPASALGMTQSKDGAAAAAAVVLGLEDVRDRLKHLAAAVSASEEEDSACQSVVKVRLTRADGSVVEKQGCRGSSVWTQVASELAAEFMAQSRYPQPAMDSVRSSAPEAGQSS